MDFKLKTLALWPKNEHHEIRTIDFNMEKVNVITGGNEKGKSSILFIIDYCLGSSKSNIPKEIRRVTGWFGVVIISGSKQILLARKSPDKQGMNDFFYKTYTLDESLDLSEIDIETSHNLVDIKSEFNRLFDLSDSAVSENEDFGWNSNPSFRDLWSLNYQPQHIMANPFTLYFKADTTENREKLKVIFPYLIGALDNEMLMLREELKFLEKRKKKTVSLIEEKKKSVENWLSEVRSYYHIARELGLVKDGPDFPEETQAQVYLDYLKRINPDSQDFIQIQEGATDEITSRISSLRDRERNSALDIQEKRHRLVHLKSLRKSASANLEATLTERNRLSGVGWFSERISRHSEDCPLCGSDSHDADKYITNLSTIQKRVDEVSNINSDSVKLFNQEIQKLQFLVSEKEKELNQIRYEIRALQDEDESYKNGRLALNNIYRFVGNLDLALKNLEATQKAGELEEELKKIIERIEEITKIYNKQVIQNRIEYAKNEIGTLIGNYGEVLEANSFDSNIYLNDENLTLEFRDMEGNEDYLWEIGSAHNYMSYHISTMLGIHEYLNRPEVSNVIPSLLIFDQPSQVYFPELDDDNKIKEEDVNKVKKIFETLSKFHSKTNGTTQILVFEHAGENTWKDFENVFKLRRWRVGEEDDGLVPKKWFSSDDGSN